MRARLRACRAREDGSGWERVGVWRRWLLGMFEDSGGKCWWESDARFAQRGEGMWGLGDVCINETDMPVSSTYRAWVSRWSPNSWVSPSTTASVHLPPPLASPTFTTPYAHESIYSPACLPRATAYHPFSTNTATSPPPRHPPLQLLSPLFLSSLSSSLEIWGARCNTFLFLLSSLSPGAFWFLLSPPLFLSLFHIPECFFSSVRLFRSWVLLKVSVCGIELWWSLFLKVLAH